ncbi:hypothetical protein G9A89_006365 [Geosiphon pyriformis]|nr:hypothetical protein G9A89_006365 [Geosiphon pyriformis]
MPRAKTASSKSPIVGEAQINAKDMWETAYIIAFCQKFKSALKNLRFWPEDLERALESGAEEDLLEDIHSRFLSNCLNRKKPIESDCWQKILSSTIDQHLQMDTSGFYIDHNPLRGKDGNINYYSLNTQNKVWILYSLINWQLQESEAVRDLINESYKRTRKNWENPLEVQELGQDSKNAKYYYIGNAARIYREKFPKASSIPTNKNVTWAAVTTDMEDIQKLVSELKTKRSAKDKNLYAMIIENVLPNVESLIQMREKKENQRKRQEKMAEKFAKMRVNAISTRTRAASRKAAGIETPVISYREDDYDYEGFAPYPTAGRSTHSRSLRGLGNDGNSSYTNSENSNADHDIEIQGALPMHGRMTRSRTSRLSRQNTVQSYASSDADGSLLGTINDAEEEKINEIITQDTSNDAQSAIKGAVGIDESEPTDNISEGIHTIIASTAGSSKNISNGMLDKATSFVSSCGSVISLSSSTSGTTDTEGFRVDSQRMPLEVYDQ